MQACVVLNCTYMYMYTGVGHMNKVYIANFIKYKAFMFSSLYCTLRNCSFLKITNFKNKTTGNKIAASNYGFLDFLCAKCRKIIACRPTFKLSM